MKKIIIRLVLVILLLFTIFGTWYNYQFSMDSAPSFEVNNNADNPKLLIATQGSLYKNFVTEEIVESLKPLKMNIKVIDVSQLKLTNAAAWNCIVIVHTWEIGAPPKVVQNFIDNTQRKDKIITLATSGEGTNQIEGVDAITSASVIEEAQDDVEVMLEKIKQVLNVEEITN